MRSLTETENPGEWAGPGQRGMCTQSPASLLCAAVGHFTNLLNLTLETGRSCRSPSTARVNAQIRAWGQLSAADRGLPACASRGSRFPLSSRTLEMGKSWALAPSSSSFPSTLLWPLHGCLYQMQPKARPACKPSAGLAHSPRADLGSALGGSGRYSAADSARLEGGRGSGGLI